MSFTLTLHIHLTVLISAHWSATSFSFLTGQVSLPCSILLRTQLLYSLPLLINDISLLVSNGANCLNLFHPIRILASLFLEITEFSYNTSLCAKNQFDLFSHLDTIPMCDGQMATGLQHIPHYARVVYVLCGKNQTCTIDKPKDAITQNKHIKVWSPGTSALETERAWS